MGISPWTRVLISTGETLEELLGRGPSNAEKWRRADFVIRYSLLASMIQIIRRVGRMLPGWAFLLTLKLEETKLSKDVIYHLINGIIAPARLPIEVVIIGTTKDASGKYPIFNMKSDPKKDAGLIREEDLVYWHENESPQPPTINKENQKNIQLIMLKNRLSSLDLAKQKKDFSSSKRNDKGELIHKEIPPDKVELIKNDVWSVIKKVWQKKINEEKIKFKKSDQNLFKEYVGWYKFVNNLTINAERKKNSKGKLKEECVIEINYKDKDLKQIRKEDIINYSLIKSIPETEYEICDRCNSFTLELFEILCLRHDPLYICKYCLNIYPHIKYTEGISVDNNGNTFAIYDCSRVEITKKKYDIPQNNYLVQNLNFMAQLIKQGLDMELNLIIPKKEIDTEFYETLKTRIANEMDIDKLNNEYSKEIEEKKPNLEEYIKNVQDLEDDEEAKFNKEISECDVFTKELKQKYKKMREDRYFLILKYKSILDQMKIDNNLEHFKDNEKYDRVNQKINDKILESELQTKRKLKLKGEPIQYHTSNNEDAIQTFIDLKNQISHKNNHEKIFNNYYSDKIQKSLNLSEYQENKLYTYLDQKIEEYNFYNVNSFDYLEKQIKIQYNKCLYRNIENDLNHYSENIEYFENNNKYEMKIHLLDKELVNENQIKSLNDKRIGNLKQFNTLSNKIIDMNHHKKRTIKLFMNIKEKIFLETDINKLENHIKQDIVWSDYQKGKLSEYTKHTLRNLDLYNKLKNQIINCEDIDEIEHNIMRKFKKISYTMNLKLKIDLFQHIENKLLNLHKNLDIINKNNIEDIIKNETGYLLLNTRNVYDEKINSLIDDPISHTEYQKF
ncbi:14706_t:CDS:2 [Dentiscutata heterogama]|uniref:14706_t:CDS:1 n=1 Tax=Dentiscutata heterogama TaxID=1316150 RepID=A0ACA9KZK4_9GLOM|nr:14706_t:CDS:2 [Dentiscutata heterogama]